MASKYMKMCSTSLVIAAAAISVALIGYLVPMIMELEVEGATFVSDLEELKNVLSQYNSDDVYVIGGESIYTLLLPMCDTAIITHVDAVADEADKKFPALSPDELILAEDSGEHECNGYKFHWCEYKRSLGVEFGEYSLKQYRYAKEYYKIVQEALLGDEKDV